ncbi:MAG: glycoside hydrolase [Anaerolineae bacterium]|nr:glycoside hydrolase [Anaerolineae bacterium]
MKRLKLFLPVLLVLLIAVPLLSAQSGVLWSEPTLMGDGWWESITVDREGTVYLGWYGSRAEETSDGNGYSADLFMLRSRPLDGQWSPAVDVLYTGIGGYTIRSSIDTSPNGMLYAAFRTGVKHDFAESYAPSSTEAASWSAPITINNSGYYLDQLVDKDGNIHLVTSEQNSNLVSDSTLSRVNQEQYDCLYCSDLIYRRSEDGGRTWTTPVNLTNTFETGSDRVDIWQGTSGRIYIDWDEGSDWYIGRGTPTDVRIIYSEDNGDTWADPIILDGGDFPLRRPIQISVTELPNERLLAVWRYSTDEDVHIYYQLSDDVGETWTEPEAIPNLIARHMNDTPLDDYELIIDNLGIGHLFLAARPESDPSAPASLYALEFRQGRWLTPRVVVSGEENVWPEWPKAVVGPKNDIHLSWFVRRPEKTATGLNLTAGLQVYYSYRTGTLPDAPTQAFVPTDAPPPTQAVTRVFQPTATPFPTVEPLEVVNVEANSDIYATRMLIGGVLSSLVLCGFVLVVVGYRLRR